MTVALAGCDDASAPTTTTPTSQTASSSAIPTAPSPSAVLPSQGPQTNPVDLEAISPGGSLSVATAGFPASWNPWSTSTFALSEAADAMTPRLFSTGADGVLRWDATWLATPPVLASADSGPMTVTYTLNPQAAWGDGAPVTAQDFIATWQGCHEPQPLPVCQDRGFEQVIGVAQGDTPATVVVTYESAYADWAYTFARGPQRADLFATAGARAEIWATPGDHPGAFAGPYQVASTDDSTIVLVRNPLWWGSFPKLDQLSFHSLDSGDLTLAYLRGDIDAFWVSDGDLMAQAGDVSGIEVRRGSGPSSRFLMMNGAQTSLFARPAIRRAVLMALDRTALAQSDLAGLKWGGPVASSPLWLTSQPQYQDLTKVATDAVGLDDYTLKAAETLLDKEGWVADDSGQRWKDGAELTWEFLIPQGDTLTENEAFAVRAQLAKLGVRVSLTYVDSTDLSARLGQGDWAMTARTWRHTTDLAAAQRFADTNVMGYSNFSVNFQVRQAASELDSDRRAEQLDDVALDVWQDVSAIPLYDIPEILFVRPGLANFGPDGLGDIRWESVGWV